MAEYIISLTINKLFVFNYNINNVELAKVKNMYVIYSQRTIFSHIRPITQKSKQHDLFYEQRFVLYYHLIHILLLPIHLSLTCFRAFVNKSSIYKLFNYYVILIVINNAELQNSNKYQNNQIRCYKKTSILSEAMLYDKLLSKPPFPCQ